jgi:ribosome-binding factor A
MAFRQEKLEARIKDLAASFLEIASSGGSLITVTRCIVTPDTKNAIIYISVLPESKEAAAIGFAKRQRGEMRTYMEKQLNARIPYLDVEIDLGEKHRNRIDDLLREQ